MLLAWNHDKMIMLKGDQKGRNSNDFWIWLNTVENHGQMDSESLCKFVTKMYSDVPYLQHIATTNISNG